MGKSLLTRVLVILISLIFCFVILEIGLRLIGRIPTNMTDGIFEQYGSSYRLKKNIAKVTNWPSFSFTTCTNNFGFRDKNTETMDIDNKEFYVFLGASDVFANGVNYEQSFVGIFEQEVLKYNIEILNMAAGGHWFIDQEEMFKDFIVKFRHKPSIVFFGMNPLTMRIFDRKHETILVKSGYLFDKRSWIIPYLRTMVGNISSGFCFFRDNFRILENNLKGAEGRGKLPVHIDVFSKKSRMFDPYNVEQFEKHLNVFEKYCQDNQIKLIYVYLPLTDSFKLNEILNQMGKDPDDYNPEYYEKLMERHCFKNNIELINLNPLLRKQHDEGVKIRFDIDPHYNIHANRVIGEYFISEIFSQLD